MHTKIIFSADTKLKNALTAKARSQGLTVTHVLNLAAQAYVKNHIRLGAFDAKLIRSVAEADAGIILSAAQVRRKFRLQ